MPFDENKLRGGLHKALEKRPVSRESVEDAVGHITRKLRSLGEREVTSRQIGEIVMEELHKLDEVAYVRYASVYRHFQDVEAFRDEVDRLRHRRGKIPERRPALAASRRDAAEESRQGAQMKFSAFDEAAMRRALELAQRGLYSTHPNPRVGAVLARDEEIVGEGWHERAGEPHAEPIAIRAAGDRARGATAYVTLEPCSHHGRTPPCVDVLLAAGVRRVVYAVGDPNPRVNGAGAKRLKEAGLKVESGLLESEADELNAGFLMRMRHGRPFVRLKTGASLDGRIALANGKSKWITSEAARADVQHWRAQSGAVLTSAATVLADDPRLDVRIETPRQPLRVVLDRRRALRKTARILAPPGDVLMFAAPTAQRKRRVRATSGWATRASSAYASFVRISISPRCSRASRSSRSTTCWWRRARGSPARCSPRGSSTNGCCTSRRNYWARMRNRWRPCRDSRSSRPRPEFELLRVEDQSAPICACAFGRSRDEK